VLSAVGCGGGDEPTVTPVEDSSVDTATHDDTKTTDTLVADSFVADTYVADTSVADDTFVPDTFVADTTVADTTVEDTAVMDTTVADTSVADTFVADTSVADSGSDTTTGSCSGEGFAATGTSFALPTAYTGAWFNDLSGSTSCGSSYSRPAYQVFDIDGDGKQDLVIMDSCTTGSDVGNTRWLVHKNNGAAFVGASVDWALPTAYTGAWFNALSGSTSCGSSYSRPAYQVFDIDGDGKQDLVVMDSCTTGSDVGNTRWLVHKNNGAAFAGTSVDWALPTAYTGAWFNDLSGSTSCGSSYSRPAYQVFDIDRDGKQDLVVMDSCATGSDVGYTHWLVHKNDGARFAASSTSWCLPTAYTRAWYNALSGSTSCGSSYSRPAYAVLDVDGAGRIDLVVMDSCDSGSTVGNTTWLVH